MNSQALDDHFESLYKYLKTNGYVLPKKTVSFLCALREPKCGNPESVRDRYNLTLIGTAKNIPLFRYRLRSHD